ncbi:DUF2752 domain-containing protein [Frankia sp. AiPa1]|uniref:DUF2752 domain-containing protein n=1 Tax=Frankia sp. AiPa1 TaxID=573492 RepID=UPI00202B0E8A|nr:DUF2752 domain-containing protein [Frankia sp. AiPa1]MCL9762064.1 DUF2752 domain-containing protein [Frankia sp. AiPa1]
MTPTPTGLAPPVRPEQVTPEQARRRRGIGVAVAAGAVAGLGYLVGHDPHDPRVAMPLCPVRHLTRLDCPACGSLRATYDLLHGHWAHAAHDNVFALACAPLLAVLLTRQARAVWQGRRAPLPAAPAYGLGAAAAVWMLVRNICG